MIKAILITGQTSKMKHWIGIKYFPQNIFEPKFIRNATLLIMEKTIIPSNILFEAANTIKPTIKDAATRVIKNCSSKSEKSNIFL